MRGRDIIRVGGLGGRGVLRAGGVTETTSSVNGMLSYKWLSADQGVNQLVCFCVYPSIYVYTHSKRLAASIPPPTGDNTVRRHGHTLPL